MCPGMYKEGSELVSWVRLDALACLPLKHSSSTLMNED